MEITEDKLAEGSVICFSAVYGECSCGLFIFLTLTML